jgi:hypothetical protein
MAFISFTRERVGQVEAPDPVDQTAPRLKGPRLVKDDDE